MNNKRNLFNIVTCKMKPRHMKKALNDIFVTRSNESDFSFMQKNSMLYRNLKGSQYILPGTAPAPSVPPEPGRR